MPQAVHYLGAQWRTFCGLIIGRDPITPTDDVARTTAETSRGLTVTYVRADVTCGRCLRGLRPIYPEERLGAAVVR